MKEVKLVTLSTPCTACLIISNLIKEIFERLSTRMLPADFIILEFDNIKDIYKVEGLEVDKLPAIIIDGEQVTAGSLPNIKYLISIIEE